jgi:hypothetical protein
MWCVALRLDCDFCPALWFDSQHLAASSLGPQLWQLADGLLTALPLLCSLFFPPTHAFTPIETPNAHRFHHATHSPYNLLLLLPQTTVVHNADVIPTICPGSADTLRAEVMRR